VAGGAADTVELPVPELLASHLVEAEDVQPVVTGAGAAGDVNLATGDDRR